MRKFCKDSPNKGLSFLYNNAAGRILLKPLVSFSFVSKITGRFMDSKTSKFMIKPFIKKNKINMDDYENVDYKSFNDFFTRAIKKGKRKIINDQNAFISPCDSKLTCYKIDDNTIFKVKNSLYSISSVTKLDDVTEAYKGGYALVFRLSPDDYHRYCYVDDGKIIYSNKIDGKFHTVNPIVYDKFEVFKENTRECTIIKTKNFGKLIYIEVGALLVGKIKNFKNAGNVKKGEEKGYFEYGGSTIIILVEKDKIIIDDDILSNSKNELETYVKYGEKIGKKII